MNQHFRKRIKRLNNPSQADQVLIIDENILQCMPKTMNLGNFTSVDDFNINSTSRVTNKTDLSLKLSQHKTNSLKNFMKTQKGLMSDKNNELTSENNETFKILKEKQGGLINRKAFDIKYRGGGIKQNAFSSQKIQNMVKNFIHKLKRNNAYSSITITQKDLEHFQQIQELKGWKINENILHIFKSIYSLVVLILIISQSFSFSFKEISNSMTIQLILVFSAIVFFLEIIINLFSIKKISGNTQTILKDIILHYFKSGYLIIDVFILVLIIAQLAVQYQYWSDILMVCLMLEVQNLLKNFNKLEQLIVKNYYYQKYFSLLKIFIFNFLFAHVIAILLNQVALGNYGNSWQTVKGIQNSNWIERYIWSYYWATTIMLTVGFGDITPTNTNQALCVTFIQFISCIAFSYNISCIGTLISNIKSQSDQIDKKRKIFEGMDKKIGFSGPLFTKVEHYINQSAEIRTKFNISQEKEFIENLPEGYRKQVTCQTNKKLLKSLPFFSCLLDRTIYKIAQHMERHIYYPQQLIKSLKSSLSIYVLENGKIGYVCKKSGSSYNNVVANQAKVSNNQHPLIISQEFITLKQLNYEIKSINYSVIHKLSYETFINELRNTNKDYEFFKFLQDKSKHYIDQFQSIYCQLCKSKHTNFDCPKYHYVPIKELIIKKSLLKDKNLKNQRYDYDREDYQPKNALAQLRQYQQNVHLISKNEIVNIFRVKMTEKQKEMKRFIANFYNFSQKRLGYQEQQSESFDQNNEIDTLRLMKAAQQLNDQYSQFWDLQIDSANDYDIYFPEGNASKIGKKQKHQHLRRKVMSHHQI